MGMNWKIWPNLAKSGTEKVESLLWMKPEKSGILRFFWQPDNLVYNEKLNFEAQCLWMKQNFKLPSMPNIIIFDKFCRINYFILIIQVLQYFTEK